MSAFTSVPVGVRFPVHASGRAMSYAPKSDSVTVDEIWIARKAEEGWRNKQRLATWRAKLKLYGWEYV